MNDRLYRSRHDRRLAGVAGGLAELWGADPSLVRVVWAVLVFLTGGIALLVYIVMALVVPDEDEIYPIEAGVADSALDPVRVARAARAQAWAAHRAERDVRRRAEGGLPGGLIMGVILILIGGYFLLRQWLPAIDFEWIWPAALIALGGLLLVGSLGRSSQPPGGQPATIEPTDAATTGTAVEERP